MRNKINLCALLILAPVCSYAESDLFVEKMFKAMPYKVYFWNRKLEKLYSPNQSPFAAVSLKREGLCSMPGQDKVLLKSRVITDDFVYFYYIPRPEDAKCRLSFLDIGSGPIKLCDNNKPIAMDMSDVASVTGKLEEFSDLLGEYQFLKHDTYSHESINGPLISLSLLAGVIAISPKAVGAEGGEIRKWPGIISLAGFGAAALLALHSSGINHTRKERREFIQEELWQKLEHLRSESTDDSSEVLFPVKE